MGISEKQYNEEQVFSIIDNTDADSWLHLYLHREWIIKQIFSSKTHFTILLWPFFPHKENQLVLIITGLKLQGTIKNNANYTSY